MARHRRWPLWAHCLAGQAIDDSDDPKPLKISFETNRSKLFGSNRARGRGEAAAPSSNVIDAHIALCGGLLGVDLYLDKSSDGIADSAIAFEWFSWSELAREASK